MKSIALRTLPGELNYAISFFSTREPQEAVQMHVLARAYRDAWRVTHAYEPVGCHVIASLDLIIEFSSRSDRQSHVQERNS